MGYLIRLACGVAVSAALFFALACGSGSSPSSPSSPTVPVDPSVLPSMSLMLAAINGVPTFVLDGGAKIAVGFQYISLFVSWLS